MYSKLLYVGPTRAIRGNRALPEVAYFERVGKEEGRRENRGKLPLSHPLAASFHELLLPTRGIGFPTRQPRDSPIDVPTSPSPDTPHHRLPFPSRAPPPPSLLTLHSVVWRNVALRQTALASRCCNGWSPDTHTCITLAHTRKKRRSLYATAFLIAATRCFFIISTPPSRCCLRE